MVTVDYIEHLDHMIVIVLFISAMWDRLTVGYDFGDVGVDGRDGDGPGVSSRAVP